jgi:hypothetical protein
VPLGVIDAAVDLLMTGTIVNYEYDPVDRRPRLRRWQNKQIVRR